MASEDRHAGVMVGTSEDGGGSGGGGGGGGGCWLTAEAIRDGGVCR